MQDETLIGRRRGQLARAHGHLWLGERGQRWKMPRP